MANVTELAGAARKHLENGDIDDALELSRQALERAPRSPKALKAYAGCMIATGDLEAAASCLAQVLKIKPEDAEAAHDLAITKQMVGDPEAAELQLQRAVDLEPENALFHDALGVHYASIGNVQRALQLALRAHELDPDDTRIQQNLASLMMQIGAPFDALNYLSSVLENDPKNTAARSMLASVYHELSDHESGFEHAKNAYLANPRDPVVLSAYAQSLCHVGRAEEAGEAADKALKLAPDLLPAAEARAIASIQSGAPHEGVTLLSDLLKKNASNPHLCLALARAMLRSGKTDEAIRLAELAEKEPASAGEARALLGHCHALKGDFAKMSDARKNQGGEGSEGSADDKALPDAVVIPFETKPVEAILLSRFLTQAYGGSDASTHAPPKIYAAPPLVPFLERLVVKADISPLEEDSIGKAVAKQDTALLTDYALDAGLSEYSPGLFKPYISSDGRADDFWAETLKPFKRPFVGISWSKTRPGALLEDVAAGLKVWPGTVFSLIWDDQRHELEGNNDIVDAGRHLASLEALIDMIHKMDLIVAPDDLILHLAGAQNVRSLGLVTPDLEWYMHEQYGRSYWYPSVELVKRDWTQSHPDYQQDIASAAAAAAAAASTGSKDEAES